MKLSLTCWSAGAHSSNVNFFYVIESLPTVSRQKTTHTWRKCCADDNSALCFGGYRVEIQ